jgi:hypothetical protein
MALRFPSCSGKVGFVVHDPLNPIHLAPAALPPQGIPMLGLH